MVSFLVRPCVLVSVSLVLVEIKGLGDRKERRYKFLVSAPSIVASNCRTLKRRLTKKNAAKSEIFFSSSLPKPTPTLPTMPTVQSEIVLVAPDVGEVSLLSEPHTLALLSFTNLYSSSPTDADSGNINRDNL